MHEQGLFVNFNVRNAHFIQEKNAYKTCAQKHIKHGQNHNVNAHGRNAYRRGGKKGA